MCGGGKALSVDIDFVVTRLNERGVDTLGLPDVAHANRTPQGVAVRPGGGVPHMLSVTMDDLSSPEHRLWISNDKGHQQPLQ